MKVEQQFRLNLSLMDAKEVMVSSDKKDYEKKVAQSAGAV